MDTGASSPLTVTVPMSCATGAATQVPPAPQIWPPVHAGLQTSMGARTHWHDPMVDSVVGTRLGVTAL